MANVKIVTDSVANLTQEEIEKYDISVVPLNILVDGVTYSDTDESIIKENFPNILKTAKQLPKTSMPAVGAFLELYDSFEEGTQIISIHISSALSGTYDGASQAAELSKNNVTVIDSVMADRGQAFQVIEAAKLAQQGASVSEIMQRIKEVLDHTELYVCVFSLNNLVKGGRVSRAKGLLSSLLDIKVIFEFANGVLEPMKKGRGAKSIQAFLESTIYPNLHSEKTKECAVSYVEETPFINQMMTEIANRLPEDKRHFGYTIPTVSIHTGEGAFAVIYYNEEA